MKLIGDYLICFITWEIVWRGCWSKWEALAKDTEKTKQMIRIKQSLMQELTKSCRRKET